MVSGQHTLRRLLGTGKYVQAEAGAKRSNQEILRSIHLCRSRFCRGDQPGLSLLTHRENTNSRSLGTSKAMTSAQDVLDLGRRSTAALDESSMSAIEAAGIAVEGRDVLGSIRRRDSRIERRSSRRQSTRAVRFRSARAPRRIRASWSGAAVARGIC